jgi:predicted negative regulator of RcsB-dependent stress response
MGKFDKSYAELQKELAAQDAQLAKIQNAETRFENTGDIGALISFWENLWANGGLKFNGSHWTFRLADLYIKIKQYDDALRAVKMIKGPEYKEKKSGYIEKIEKLSAKKKRKNS